MDYKQLESDHRPSVCDSQLVEGILSHVSIHSHVAKDRFKFSLRGATSNIDNRVVYTCRTTRALLNARDHIICEMPWLSVLLELYVDLDGAGDVD